MGKSGLAPIEIERRERKCGAKGILTDLTPNTTYVFLFHLKPLVKKF
jgi:hypothetical protein